MKGDLVNAHELYIVGRHPDEASSPLDALTEWMELSELGPWPKERKGKR